MHSPLYGDDGRVERIVVTREPEWDEEQVALLLAAAELEADVGPHGHPMAEAMSPLADPGRPEGYRYQARYRVDHAARELSTAQRNFEKAYPDADPAMYVWTVEKRYPEP